jgi:hypothetical protein
MDHMMQALYNIPYSGNIEKIDAKMAKSLSVKEEGGVASIYNIQQDRIAAAGLDVTVIAPAVAGGLIVRCAPKDAQSVYDAVFGGSVVNPRATATIVPFRAVEKQDSSLRLDFDNAAERFHVGRDFQKAAGTPALRDDIFVPAFRAA